MRNCFTFLPCYFSFFLFLTITNVSVTAQEVIWSDEFNSTSIDTSKWSLITEGIGNTDGELQQYTDNGSNAYLENGNLVLEAKREFLNGKQFTSAQLATQDKFSFRYGILEARIKMPNVANGIWPAFRMMGDTYKEVGSPKCGKTSIAELGWKDVLNRGIANRSVHAGSTWWHEQGTWGPWLQADYNKQHTISTNFFENYHTFRLEWTPTKMLASVDGHTYYEIDIQDPNLSEFVENPNFLVINLAVGGSYFVQITDPNQVSAPFPAKMSIDYIRLIKNEFTEIFGGGGVINTPPTAVLNASSIGGRAPLQVSFDASKSYDSNDDTIYYSWDFGNGDSATGATTDYTFTEKGVYTVELTVSDGEFEDTAVHTVEVTDEYIALKSKKRGVAYGYHSEQDMAAFSSGISWWYNWATQPETTAADIHLQYGVNYVPMAWNGGFREQEIIDWLEEHPEAEYILGWNEPNFIVQANMTPSKAAAEWPRLEAIAQRFGLKIVSPALNFCDVCVSDNGVTYTHPIQYFDDFFAACSNCQVDAIAIHAYMGTIEAFEWYVNLFRKYNRPIWMTEFCNWENNPTLDDQKKFLIHAVDYMENDPQVERYAWFIGRSQGFPYNTLLEPESGKLSALGKIYVNMPVHDPATYSKIPGVIEAEDYGRMKGIRLEYTTDVEGFLHVSEIHNGDFLEYSIDVQKAGDYKIIFRVAGMANTHRVEIMIDEVYHSEISFQTNGTQRWEDKETTVNLPEGKHVLKVKIASGGFYLNRITLQESTSEPSVCGDTNEALGKYAIASSIEANLNPSNAVDGLISTRWGSDFSNNQWLRIDLGAEKNVCQVVLNWEAAYGSGYTIRIGNAPEIQNSQTIARIENGDGGVDIIETDSKVSGKYLWVECLTRGTPWGFSLWEVQVRTLQNSLNNKNKAFTSSFEIFPNPAKNEISVNVANYKKGDLVEIISIMGKVIRAQVITQEKTALDISNLPSGLYILQYKGSEQQVKQFIKE